MSGKHISRRAFIGGVTTAGIGVSIVPRHVLGGPGYTPPSEKLNLAAIGSGGMGAHNMENLTSQNIVALADIDWDRVEETFVEDGLSGELRDAYAKATRYSDFREMLVKERDLDGVVIATPDHVHAVAASMAMKRGLHVYVQKPLTWSVFEARHLRETAERTGVVTQMGNQGHSSEDARRINEIVQAGVLGPVREVHVWTNRPIWPQGIPRPEDRPPVPPNVQWDLFLGPAQPVPYHPAYHPWSWRAWVDFGVGALGDMGAHLIDHPFWALGLTLPGTIEATSTPWGNPEGDDPGSYPLATLVHYDFPARGMVPAVRMTWYDGGLMPRHPDGLPGEVALDRTGGVLFVGEQGVLLHETYGENPQVFPEKLRRDLDDIPRTYPRVEGGRDGHEMNWVRAIRGEEQISSPFSYASLLTETMLLGLVALRAGQGRRIQYDAAAMKTPGAPDAEKYLHREYRDGWAL
jgi:predicted dehydrogenase